ncbi:MAG: HIT family protein [Geminicoccaceae bacterium]
MSEQPQLNPTQLRFEYPDLLVKDFPNWCVMLRRHQVTLGSLVLIAKSHATAWPDIGEPAFTELATVTAAIERTLRTAFAHDKINYLMLMMNDPNAHFHVLPRYEREITFEGMGFEDAGWPKTPELGSGPALDDDMTKKLIAHLKASWQD